MFVFAGLWHGNENGMHYGQLGFVCGNTLHGLEGICDHGLLGHNSAGDQGEAFDPPGRGGSTKTMIGLIISALGERNIFSKTCLGNLGCVFVSLSPIRNGNHSRPTCCITPVNSRESTLMLGW